MVAATLPAAAAMVGLLLLIVFGRAGE